jgi:predicted nuclease of restriction endonuclease-like (RecB) superfamily
MNLASRFSVADYESLLTDVVHVIDEARRAAARTVNAAMTATYWLIGRRIVEEEQRGTARADYGERLVKRLAHDLSRRFGRVFSKRNLWQMRAFYLAWPLLETVSAKLRTSPATARAGPIVQTVSAQLGEALAKECAARLPLPWSHYVRLLAVRSTHARAFYESEALRGGWTIRQLDRQIQSQFYERTALSRDKATLLSESDQSRASDKLVPDEEIKDPYVLEFLGLKDEYSESDLEDALLGKLQAFLLELGGDPLAAQMPSRRRRTMCKASSAAYRSTRPERDTGKWRQTRSRGGHGDGQIQRKEGPTLDRGQTKAYRRTRYRVTPGPRSQRHELAP